MRYALNTIEPIAQTQHVIVITAPISSSHQDLLHLPVQRAARFHRLDNARHLQALCQLKDHAITAPCGHDVDRDREVLCL